MAIALEYTGNGTTSSGTTHSHAFGTGNGPAAGELVVFSTRKSATAVVSGSTTNSYTRQCNHDSSNANNVQVIWKIASGSEGDTHQFATTDIANALTYTVYIFSGMHATPLDLDPNTESTNTGGSITSFTYTTAGTTAQADELAIVHFSRSSATWAGLAADGAWSTNNNPASSIVSAYKILSATGQPSYSTSWTNTNIIRRAMSTWKMAAAGGGTAAPKAWMIRQRMMR